MVWWSMEWKPERENESIRNEFRWKECDPEWLTTLLKRKSSLGYLSYLSSWGKEGRSRWRKEKSRRYWLMIVRCRWTTTVTIWHWSCTIIGISAWHWWWRWIIVIRRWIWIHGLRIFEIWFHYEKNTVLISRGKISIIFLFWWIGRY